MYRACAVYSLAVNRSYVAGSDADVAMDGMTETVTLESGDDYEDLDAGLYEPASLGDFVFLDEDGDGIQDPEDDGIEGVTVNLLDEDGNA